MITFKHKGDFVKLSTYFERVKKGVRISTLHKYGEAGVEALRLNTPKDSGLTANSWSYLIEQRYGVVSISFINTNINKGVPIAIILQFGHGTGTGGWVQGRDYINPSIQPIFDKLAEDAWREVTKL